MKEAVTVWRLVAMAAGSVMILAGCSSAGSAADALLAEHNLDGMPVEEVIDELDRLPGPERPADLMASVRVDELLLSDGEQEVGLALPDDRFYLSVAPYVSRTHDCYFHSLTTCQGELAGEDVHVTIVDAAGEVLVDERTTTFDNGFVGFWLPRDVDGTVRVSSEGRSGEVEFSTGGDSATCLTTLQLV